MTTIWSGA